MRRSTEQEGQKLQQIVRLDSTSSVRYRRAMTLLASAGENRVPVMTSSPVHATGGGPVADAGCGPGHVTAHRP